MVNQNQKIDASYFIEKNITKICKHDDFHFIFSFQNWLLTATFLQSFYRIKEQKL